MTGHHQLVIDENQRVRQVPFSSQVQHLAKLLLHGRQCGVMVRNLDSIAIDAREKSPCLPRGLLRRPSRPSTSHAYFVLAMPEDDDLYLFLSGHGLSVDFLHVNFYLCPST